MEQLYGFNVQWAGNKLETKQQTANKRLLLHFYVTFQHTSQWKHKHPQPNLYYSAESKCASVNCLFLHFIPLFAVSICWRCSGAKALPKPTSIKWNKGRENRLVLHHWLLFFLKNSLRRRKHSGESAFLITANTLFSLSSEDSAAIWKHCQTITFIQLRLERGVVSSQEQKLLFSKHLY